MDHHYDRHDTFQSEASGAGTAHDYDQPFDPYGNRCFSLPLSPSAHLFSHLLGHRHRDTDTESELDAYAQRYAPSAESLNPGMRSDASAPTFDFGHGPREPYPAWTSERQIPLSKEFVHHSLANLLSRLG